MSRPPAWNLSVWSLPVPSASLFLYQSLYTIRLPAQIQKRQENSANLQTAQREAGSEIEELRSFKLQAKVTAKTVNFFRNLQTNTGNTFFTLYKL